MVEICHLAHTARHMLFQSGEASRHGVDRMGGRATPPSDGYDAGVRQDVRWLVTGVATG